MTTTVSGHPAIKSWSSPMLAARPIPGTRINIRTRKSCLPLFLHLAARLNKEVRRLNPRDTWSYNFRPIRMGQSAVSDHAGYAIDLWSSTTGATRGRAVCQQQTPARSPASLRTTKHPTAGTCSAGVHHGLPPVWCSKASRTARKPATIPCTSSSPAGSPPLT
jgi:hypothetical protein